MMKNKLKALVVCGAILFGMGHAFAAESGKSIFQMPLKFADESGKKMDLGAFLKGKKAVVSMVYTSCQSACPLIVKKLKAVQKKLDEQKVDVRFAVVSFDPATDSPEKMKHFRHHMDIDRSNWTMFVGSAQETRKLSMLLGIKFSRNPKSGEIMHDNKIVLLNEAGEVVRTLEGLDAEFDTLF